MKENTDFVQDLSTHVTTEYAFPKVSWVSSNEEQIKKLELEKEILELKVKLKELEIKEIELKSKKNTVTYDYIPTDVYTAIMDMQDAKTNE